MKRTGQLDLHPVEFAVVRRGHECVCYIADLPRGGGTILLDVDRG
jgi:hypothetical protein